ncbi:MAG: hypothetical protein AB1Z21_09290 [Synechococcaceae cyanobacterium]
MILTDRRRYLRPLSLIACLAVTCSSAFAKPETSARFFCHTVGAAPPEPLGDKDGHAISVSQFTCRGVGGLTDGGVLTGTTIYEWDHNNGVLLSRLGVNRKPGATTAYQHMEGKVSLIVANGKVTGAALSGRGRMTMATGTASSLQGKRYRYSGTTTGPGLFTIEVNYD